MGIHTQPSLVRSLTAGFLADPRKHGHPSEAQTEKPDFFAKFASHPESPSLFTPLMVQLSLLIAFVEELLHSTSLPAVPNLPAFSWPRFLMPRLLSCGLEALLPSFVSSSSLLLCFCSSRVHET